jgi:hypothetical protein
VKIILDNKKSLCYNKDVKRKGDISFMGKSIYVLTNNSEGEVVAASESKESIVNYAVSYIVNNIYDYIEGDVPDDLDDDEYEEEFKRVQSGYEEKIREWATDLVNGNIQNHYADEFSYHCQVWISIVELI